MTMRVELMSTFARAFSSSVACAPRGVAGQRCRAGTRAAVLPQGCRRRSATVTAAMRQNGTGGEGDATSSRAVVDPSMTALAIATAVALETAMEASVAYAGLYDSVGVPTEEATPLQNLFGVLFTGFSFWYFVRAVKRRSGKAREFRVANQLPEEERKRIDEERAAKTKALSPMQSFTGGATGIGISIVLYMFASKITGSFDGKALPESETVRQISITVRTIVEGLAYLATFVYAANGVGLIALGVQKTLDYSSGVDLIDQANKEFEQNYLKKQREEEEKAKGEDSA
uniref:Uncharacterized protein n=1 Tax=Ostreococcus mediterraneus TaxID=1486918 RepID=A0A6U0DVJ5_9CHLO